MRDLYTMNAMVRLEGFEPPSIAYRATALPLCYRRKLGRGDWNRTSGLTVPNRALLLLSYTPSDEPKRTVQVVGFEPTSCRLIVGNHLASARRSGRGM